MKHHPSCGTTAMEDCECATITTHLDAVLMQRAVLIADDCMRSEIECAGVGIGETLQDHRYGLVDENCSEVRTLAEADWALREAFEYLRDRGLATLLPDDGHGEIIQLHAERFAR